MHSSSLLCAQTLDMLGDGGIFFTRDIGLHLLKGLLSHVDALHSRKKDNPFAESDNSNFLAIVYAVLKIKKLMTGMHGDCTAPKFHAGFWEILSSKLCCHTEYSAL